MASTTITVPTLRASQDAVRHFFGTRLGPLLSHATSMPRLQGVVLPERAFVVSVKQVHGTDILVVDNPGQLSPEAGWDALLTDQPDVILTVRTADCVPVLLHDPVKRVVAAVHAGWRGTVAGIVPLTLARMAKRYGSNPRTTRVGIGPSIGPCCYEVDKPVLDRVCASGVEYRNVVQDKGGGKAMLDLGALVRFQARAAGVPAEHIDRVELCTVCHPDLFYSYRREGAVVGTMVSGIMLVPQRRTAGH